jgi:hypothetical protein
MVDFARSLARRGLREDALLILDLLPAGDSVETLDLKARILTQLGRYAEAEDAWQKVIAESPDHQGAAEGLAAVAVLRRKPLARFRVACALRFRRVATVFLVLLLVLLAVTSAGLLWQRLHSLGHNQQALLDVQEARSAEVDKRLAAVRQDAADLANLQLNLRDSLGELKDSMAKIQAQIKAGNEASADTRKELLARVSQSAAALKREVGKLEAATKTQVDQLKSAQAATAKSLQTQTASLLQQQKGTTASLAKLAELSGTSGDALDKSLAGLRKELTALKPTVAALAEANGKQAAALATTRTELADRLAALDKQVGRLLAADPNEKLGELSGQYLQLRAGLNTQKKQTEALLGRLKELSGQLAGLSRAVDGLAKQAAGPVPPASAPAAE